MIEKYISAILSLENSIKELKATKEEIEKDIKVKEDNVSFLLDGIVTNVYNNIIEKIDENDFFKKDITGKKIINYKPACIKTVLTENHSGVLKEKELLFSIFGNKEVIVLSVKLENINKILNRDFVKEDIKNLVEFY
jgi:hypothetical protein